MPNLKRTILWVVLAVGALAIIFFIIFNLVKIGDTVDKALKRVPELSVKKIFLKGGEGQIDSSFKILNTGKRKAKAITVQIFDENLLTKKKVLIGEEEIESLSAEKQQEINKTWPADFGIHKISLIIDPENKIQEVDKQNNILEQGVFVYPLGTEESKIKEEDLLKKVESDQGFNKDLYNYAQGLGYEQLLGDTSVISEKEKTEITIYLLESREKKIVFLVEISNNSLKNLFLVNKEEDILKIFNQENNLSLNLKEGSILTSSVKDGCNYNHCLGSCFLQFWPKNYTDNFCSDCLINPGLATDICFTCLNQYLPLIASCSFNCQKDSCGFCSTDKCGENEWLGDLYCSEGNIYQNLKEYTCQNPGEISSHCEFKEMGKPKKECEKDVYSEWGQPYCKDNDAYHQRTKKISTCLEGKCLSSEETEEGLISSCPLGCLEGKCKGNNPPIASAGEDFVIDEQKINEPVIFVGQGSSPEGKIVKYEWDFDGDGKYDWQSSQSGNTTYTYTSPAEYRAKLRVTNSQGLTAEDEVLVKFIKPGQETILGKGFHVLSRWEIIKMGLLIVGVMVAIFFVAKYIY